MRDKQGWKKTQKAIPIAPTKTFKIIDIKLTTAIKTILL
jgi:hypothetical protein